MAIRAVFDWFLEQYENMHLLEGDEFVISFSDSDYVLAMRKNRRGNENDILKTKGVIPYPSETRIVKWLV